LPISNRYLRGLVHSKSTHSPYLSNPATGVIDKHLITD
jgi:hypothetical protein